jgi:type VI protein secretion system component VasK
MMSQQPDGSQTRGGYRPLLIVHFAAAIMAVVDFMVFHAAAVGLAIAIYYGVPLVDDAISRNNGDWDWLGIFKIVSPTVTLPGGAVTVLSTYFYARRIQEMEKEKQEAEEARRDAEAQVQILKAQLEQANAPRRRNRRRLRNGTSRRGE